MNVKQDATNASAIDNVRYVRSGKRIERDRNTTRAMDREGQIRMYGRKYVKWKRIFNSRKTPIYWKTQEQRLIGVCAHLWMHAFDLCNFNT